MNEPDLPDIEVSEITLAEFVQAGGSIPLPDFVDTEKIPLDFSDSLYDMIDSVL